MKFKIKYIILIFVVLLILSFKNIKNPVFINGHLKPKNAILKNDIVGLKIFIKADGQILAESYTDKNGDFNLTFTPENEKSFDFFCSGIGIGTILLKSVEKFESNNVEMNLNYTAKYKKNILGKVVCLKCKKTDKIYEILYSDSPIVTRKINKFGDTIYNKIYKNKYREGCIVEPAKYYCERDDVKF
ncbi:Hypothetical transmembrane protein [Flavobacterium branchiophilum]|uniref:Hypothetical transmembrane protein n=1 Tax=Flavobacterium branchiophilum (strain FL-15) TaxID=1034807 RepID=G2YZW8_FLABF|nr:hypothetical protein [Flavobacterium branchiophilum]CCB69221.1 Hypothetical transmembrane protein [Flavobacterium branchiophilum FL-15]